jgi:hypothetical protein
VALKRMPSAALPLPVAQILLAVSERERLVGTYLGHGIGMPPRALHELSARGS